MASTPDLQDVIDQGDDPGGGEIDGAGAIAPQITNSHFIESIYQEHFSIISENRKLVRNNTRIDPSLDVPDIDGAIGHTITNINIIESSEQEHFSMISEDKKHVTTNTKIALDQADDPSLHDLGVEDSENVGAVTFAPVITNSDIIESSEKEHCSMISENRKLVRNNTRIDPSLDVPDIDGAIGHTITNINIIESSEQEHFSMISEDKKHVTTNTKIALDQADDPSLHDPCVEDSENAGAVTFAPVITNSDIIESNEKEHCSMISEDRKLVTNNTRIALDQADDPLLDDPGVEDSEDAGAGEAFAPASTIDYIIESIEQDCCCSMISEDVKSVTNNNRTTLDQAEGQSDIEIDSEGAARKESNVTLINADDDNIESSEQDYSFSSMISEDWKFVTEHTRIVVLPDPRLSSLLSQEDDISSTGTSDIQGEGLEELEYEYEPGIALGHMEFNASESLMQTSMNVSQCDSHIAMNESTCSMGGSMVTSTLSVHGATQGNLLRGIDNYFGVA